MTKTQATMTQIETLTARLTTGQKKLAVGGATGALIVGVLSCCTPIKLPLWVGFVVGVPVAFVTDWRGSEVSTGRDASRYTREVEAILAIVAALEPGSPQAQQALLAGAKLLNHAAGGYAVATLPEVHDDQSDQQGADTHQSTAHEREREATALRSLERTHGTQQDSALPFASQTPLFDESHAGVESDISVDDLLRRFALDFPDLDLGETATSEREEVLQKHF